jgi:hypothetical protein
MYFVHKSGRWIVEARQGKGISENIFYAFYLFSATNTIREFEFVEDSMEKLIVKLYCSEFKAIRKDEIEKYKMLGELSR